MGALPRAVDQPGLPSPTLSNTLEASRGLPVTGPPCIPWGTPACRAASWAPPPARAAALCPVLLLKPLSFPPALWAQGSQEEQTPSQGSPTQSPHTAEQPWPPGARTSPGLQQGRRLTLPGHPQLIQRGQNAPPKTRGSTRRRAQRQQPAWHAIPSLTRPPSCGEWRPPQIQVYSEGQSVASFGNRTFAVGIKFR